MFSSAARRFMPEQTPQGQSCSQSEPLLGPTGQSSREAHHVPAEHAVRCTFLERFPPYKFLEGTTPSAPAQSIRHPSTCQPGNLQNHRISITQLYPGLRTRTHNASSIPWSSRRSPKPSEGAAALRSCSPANSFRVDCCSTSCPTAAAGASGPAKSGTRPVRPNG